MTRRLYSSTKKLFFITLHHPTDIEIFKNYLKVCLDVLNIKEDAYLKTIDLKGKITRNQPSIEEHMNLFSYMGLFIKEYENPNEDNFSFIYIPTNYFHNFFTKAETIKKNWKRLFIDRLLKLEIINNAIFRDDFFELKNLRLRPYLISLLILDRLNKTFPKPHRKKITQNLVIAILCTLKNERLSQINLKIKKILKLIEKRGTFITDKFMKELYPSIKTEIDAIGINAASHELSRIQSVIIKPLKQLGLIEKKQYLKLTDKGKSLLREYIKLKPIWWADIGGKFNAAILLLMKNIHNIEYDLFEKVISTRNLDKDLSSVLKDLIRIGIRRKDNKLVLKQDIQFDYIDIPSIFQNDVRNLYNELNSDLILNSFPDSIKYYVKSILNKLYLVKKQFEELEEKYNQLYKRNLHSEEIDKWEMYLRKINPDIINLGIPKILWDLKFVAQNDPNTAKYYKDVYNKQIWDIFEYQTWEAFRFLGMKVIKLGHSKRFESLPDSGIINFRTLKKYGKMPYLILIDNKCTRNIFNIDRFNDYKDKLKDYVYDAYLSASGLYYNCQPDYFIILSSEFSKDILNEVKLFEKSLLKLTDTKIKLMCGIGLAQLVFEHAKRPYVLKEHDKIFENNILNFEGIIDENVITNEFYSKIP